MRPISIVLSALLVSWAVGARAAEEALALPVAPVAVSLQGAGFKLLIGPSGAIQLQKDGEVFDVHSAFSYPGTKIGCNRLAEAPGKDPDALWKPAVHSSGEGSAVVSARCASYAFERTVRVEGDKVRVLDKFTNLSPEAVGVGIEHSVATSKPFKTCLLGGMPEPSTGSLAGNPTVFIAAEDAGLGIFAVDDVLRLRLAVVIEFSRVLLGQQHFAMDQGKSYTFEWMLYPLDRTADYWAFVNRVRKDLNLDYAIEGPFSFFEGQPNMRLLDDPQALKAYLQRKHIKIAAMGPPLDFDNLDRATGKLVTRDQYKETMQKAATALRAADPNIRVIACLETFPVPLSLEDARKLYDRMPSKEQGYPVVTDAMLEGIAQMDARRRQSLIRTADGKYVSELYFRAMANPDGSLNYDKKLPLAALVAYPAPGNAQQEFLMEQARFVIEEVGLDGIYIDSFSLAGDNYPADQRFSYDGWDGTTVDMDPATGRIARKYVDVELAGAPAKMELIQYVLKAGRVFVANGYSPTREAQSLPAFRFEEAEWGFDPLALGKGEEPPLFKRMCGGHLSTPIGLGYRPERLKDGEQNYARIIMETVITYLRHGGLFCHYLTEIPAEGPGSGEYGPINHMYPITPVELHEGYIIGKERIITAVSGTYVWKQSAKPTVLVFDITGRPIEARAEIQPVQDGWSVKLSIENWENVAVIE
jgi:hypothetical protein